MDTNEIILDELRQLRADYNQHAVDTASRLSKLESQMYSLVGNGQPGRIANIESDVDTLKGWRWSLVGAAGAISIVVSVGAWVLERVWK